MKADVYPLNCEPACQQNLAGFWLDSGRFQEAEVGLRSCLQSAEGMDLQYVLPMRNNLANALQRQGALA